MFIFLSILIFHSSPHQTKAVTWHSDKVLAIYNIRIRSISLFSSERQMSDSRHLRDDVDWEHRDITEAAPVRGTGRFLN
jgi:hypothetical protein